MNIDNKSATQNSSNGISIAQGPYGLAIGRNKTRMLCFPGSLGSDDAANDAHSVADGNNQFSIENGMVLQGFPRENPDNAALKWPDEDVQCVEDELFTANAHFLFENRDRIFADSRMFLAPVNIMSGAAYIGALPKPTVGTYIEWWLRRGTEELAYFVSGSPLSGTNVSLSIAKDGSHVPLQADFFMNLAGEFRNAHYRYIEERKRFEAYSLIEVVMRLKGTKPSYEDALTVQVLERKLKSREKEIEALGQRLYDVNRRCQSYKDKYKNALRQNQASTVVESKM